MQEKSTTTKRLLGNLNRLLPFVGFLMVIAGIIGLVFVQKPLNETQDLRSDASQEVQTIWPVITAANPDQDFTVDEDSQILLNLTTSELTLKKLNLVFNIINSDFETPEVSIINTAELKSKKLEIEKTEDGYLVNLQAIPVDQSEKTFSSDSTLLSIDFIPKKAGTIAINFDEDNSYIDTPSLAYAIDTQNISFDIKDKQNVNEEADTTRSCNESCSSNADCQVNYRCFNTGSENKCRLVTNPSSSTCSVAPLAPLNRQCNEGCATSNDCKQGLTCWLNTCRNPENIESVSCANLTSAQQIQAVNSCGEGCSSNADCAVNFRCYKNECRLASNPSSLTCSTATVKTVSLIYDKILKDDQQPSGEAEEVVVPIKKGDNLIPESETEIGKIEEDKLNNRVNADQNEEVPAEETAFDFLMNMLKDKQQSLPTTIILIGIGLLAASLIVLLIARLLQARPSTTNMNLHKSTDLLKERVVTHEINPSIPNTGTSESERLFTQEIAKQEKVKDLMKSLEERSKNQN